jgi:hypothetical protein
MDEDGEEVEVGSEGPAQPVNSNKKRSNEATNPPSNKKTKQAKKRRLSCVE